MNDYRCVGNLYKDCTNDLKTSTTGTEYVTFTVCVNQGKDNSGNDIAPLYVNCIAYKSMAKRFVAHATKGQGYVIIGFLKPVIKEGKQIGLNVAVRNLYPIAKNAKDTSTFDSNESQEPFIPENIVTDDDLPF